MFTIPPVYFIGFDKMRKNDMRKMIYCMHIESYILTFVSVCNSHNSRNSPDKTQHLYQCPDPIGQYPCWWNPFCFSPRQEQKWIFAPWHLYCLLCLFLCCCFFFWNIHYLHLRDLGEEMIHIPAHKSNSCPGTGFEIQHLRVRHSTTAF